MHLNIEGEYTFKYISVRGRHLPALQIKIKASRTARVLAIIDSGAIVSLFPFSIAEDTGIDLSDAEDVYLAGVGGICKSTS